MNEFLDDVEVTQEPDFDVGELSSTGRQVEVSLGGAVQLECPTGKLLYGRFNYYYVNVYILTITKPYNIVAKGPL